MFVTVAPVHLAHQLQLTTWHVGYNETRPACISVRVTFNQQICLNQLQLTCKHICSWSGWTSRYIFYTYLKVLISTIAPDHQACMLQLHKSSYLVFYKLHTISIQHTCLLQLHLITIHVNYICTPPLVMTATIASDHLSSLSQLHLTSSHVF